MIVCFITIRVKNIIYILIQRLNVIGIVLINLDIDLDKLVGELMVGDFYKLHLANLGKVESRKAKSPKTILGKSESLKVPFHFSSLIHD